MPLKRVIVDEDSSKVWCLYDAGPKDVTCPIIFFPPVSATGEVFFKQIMFLSRNGYRVIAVSYPIYWSMREYVSGFVRLMDHMKLDKVHIFGASVGGFIAQKIAESLCNCQRIHSLILCNSFTDTATFNQTETSNLFWLIPGPVLKNRIVNMPAIRSQAACYTDSEIADSMIFVAESLDKMSQQELAARLTINCASSYVEPHRLATIEHVTIIDVFDHSALSQSVRETLYKTYPGARRAHLKTGGNFPYLSRCDEVNLHIVVHLRTFTGTRYSAQGINRSSMSSSSPRIHTVAHLPKEQNDPLNNHLTEPAEEVRPSSP